MTFAEAFAKARKEQGPGGVFTTKVKSILLIELMIKLQRIM